MIWKIQGLIFSVCMRAFIINVHGLIGQSGSGDQQCQVEQPNVQDDLYSEDVGLCNQLIPRNN